MDYLVIGAGPAGLRFGYFLHQAGRDYLILEAGATPGTTYRRFPRRRAPEAAGGDVFDPADFARHLADFAVTHELNIQYHARVIRVARGGDGDHERRFMVTDQSGRVYRPKRVIVATGLGRPYLPSIPGIESAERYDEAEAEPADFADQRVLIIGRGDAAFATARRLAERAAVVHVVGPRAASATRIARLNDLTGRRWASNEIFIAPRRRAARDAVLDATIRRIERADTWGGVSGFRMDEPDGQRGQHGQHAEHGWGGRRGPAAGPAGPAGPDGAGEFVVTLSGARQAGSGRMRMAQLRYDRVIACTGFQMDPSIFDPSCRPEPALNGRLPALTSEWESVNVPDLYFAGALARVGAGADRGGSAVHGLRYCMRALRRMLDRKYEGIEWPYRELSADAESLTAAVLDRVNRSPGLFQRYAVLCDLIVVAPNARLARYYEEMPVDYVHDSLFGGADRYFTVSLEYGEEAGAPDSPDLLGDVADRTAEPAEPRGDRYLRPVVRHYRRWSLVAVQRLPEDVDHDWADEAEYRTPLLSFFARQMALSLA
ncbi:MAG TPA: NAD(P)-binding domain-containing protein [Streptosporangiaceae bacterium]|nr:NAD(P)-binding domain-containing protein [Streptosporangiaceae bacterium]